MLRRISSLVLCQQLEDLTELSAGVAVVVSLSRLLMVNVSSKIGVLGRTGVVARLVCFDNCFEVAKLFGFDSVFGDLLLRVDV